MSRYARQMILPDIGVLGQARLAAARVLVIGAGGLGSALLPLLAGAGVGAIRIIDPDRIEESNLHRQTLYRMVDLGQPKAEVAARALLALNPGCRVSARVARADPLLMRAELPGADLVVDAADAFAVTYALSDLCLAARKPLISASVIGRAGHVGGFCGGAPSYRSVFPDLPPALQSCATGGVMGPVVATLGALQAQMVLSVLLGHHPSPLGQMITVDMAEWRLSSFRFGAAVEPEDPGPAIISQDEILPDDLLIELRGEAETPELPLTRAWRLASADLVTLTPGPGQRVVFICATGLRAWRAARQLAGRCANPVAILVRPS